MIPQGMILTDKTATMIINGKPKTVSHDHPHFEEIKQKLIDQDYDGLEELVSYEATVQRELDKQAGDLRSRFEVRLGEAYLDGEPIHGALGKKLVEELNRGQSVPGFLNFVAKLMENPSSTAVEELYLFLEAGFIALHPDGDFLAYKRVRNNYTDCYTGTIDNSVGQVVTMKRNAVDDNRGRTCSYGLHFCSFAYLEHFGHGADDRVMIVKINPKNVVSIPQDYNDTKGRCCEYLVFGEVDDWRTDVLQERSPTSWNQDPDEYDEYDEDDEDDEDDDWEYECDCAECRFEDHEEEDDDEWL